MIKIDVDIDDSIKSIKVKIHKNTTDNPLIVGDVIVNQIVPEDEYGISFDILGMNALLYLDDDDFYSSDLEGYSPELDDFLSDILHSCIEVLQSDIERKKELLEFVEKEWRNIAV